MLTRPLVTAYSGNRAPEGKRRGIPSLTIAIHGLVGFNCDSRPSSFTSPSALR